MPVLNGKLAALIVKVLGPHGPDAVLMVFAALAAMTATWEGVNAYAAGTFVIVLYALYGWRKNRHEGHLERMADKDVARLDARITQAREKHAQKVEKINSAPPSPPARSPSSGAGRRGGRR